MKATLAVSSVSFALSLLLLSAPGTSRADNLFVANHYNHTIEEFNSSGVGTLFATLPSGPLNTQGPTGLAFDSRGDLYVGDDVGYGTIYKFNSSGGVLSSNRTVFATADYGVVLDNPTDLAFDSAGNLYVVNHDFGNIEKFNSSGVGTRFAWTESTPVGLAFDTAGNLYVTDPASGDIQKFNSSGVGTVFANLPPSSSGPQGLAFDSHGNLFVSYYSKTIAEFKSTGGVLSSTGTVFARSGMDNPIGMAFDRSDNLYVANFSEGTGTGYIEEYDTSGVGKLFASLGLLDGPFDLAFETVPEPSTWAMVALGIGAVLGGLRLRRRSTLRQWRGL